MVKERGVRYDNGDELWESESWFLPTIERHAEWFRAEIIEREAI